MRIKLRSAHTTPELLPLTLPSWSSLCCIWYWRQHDCVTQLPRGMLHPEPSHTRMHTHTLHQLIHTHNYFLPSCIHASTRSEVWTWGHWVNKYTCFHHIIHSLVSAIYFTCLFAKSTIACYFIALFLQSFIHSFVNSFFNSYIHSFIHSFFRFVQYFIHKFIHSYIHSFISSFIFIHSLVNSFIHTSFIHSSTHYVLVMQICAVHCGSADWVDPRTTSFHGCVPHPWGFPSLSCWTRHL